METKFIGRRIRKFRRSLGLTQREFAMKIMINSAYLSRVEQEAQRVGMKTLETICRTFSVDLSVFLLSEDEKKMLRKVAYSRSRELEKFIDEFYKSPPKEQRIILDFLHLFFKKRKERSERKWNNCI